MALLVLAVLWLAATAWVRPLMLPDEGRYVGVAWEMLRSGNWLVPTLDGLPYFHKPPLFYWITAASLSVFGMHDGAARMAPFVGAVAAAVALHRFALRWASLRVAGLALLVLVTEPLFFIGGQFANLDMLVAGCIAVTVLAMGSAVLGAQEGRPSRPALATAYLFAALGLLAKGLIGIVLPAMIILAWLLAMRRWRTIVSLLWLPGIALFFCIAAPWFIAMQERFPDFAYYFFVVQHFKRFAAGGFNNVQPIWFYLAVLPLLTLPWSVWLAAAAQRSYWSDPQQGPIRKLMWLWLAIVTLFFSLPQSKLVGYVLPVAAPLAFLIGDAISRGWEASARRRQWTRWSAGVAAVICLGVVIGVMVAPGKSLRDMSRTLASQVGAEDTVVFLHDYYFDVPFYAQLRGPVRIVDDWDNPEFARVDNWRKELIDARQFAAVSAAPVLVLPVALPDIVCGQRTTWVVGNQAMLSRYPVLARAVEIQRHRDTVLWRVPARPAGTLSAAGCPEKPSANSEGK